VTDAEDAQIDLGYIRTHLQNIEQLVRFDIAANPGSRQAVRAVFEARPGSSKIYLTLAARPLSQEELSQAAGVSQSTVSRICQHLIDGGLLTTMRDPDRPRVTLYTPSALDRLIGVSRIAKSVKV
jgi:predicted transcriptional regulator